MPPPRTLIRAGSVVTMDPSRRVLHGGALVVSGTSIEAVLSAPELAAMPPFEGSVLNAPSLTAIPGFVQTHIHLCQTLFRGLADDLDLLDWLRLKIYPYEAAHNASSMRASALTGIAELIRSGTTTVMDMGSVEHEEEIAGAVEETGIRAFIGKAMMDSNDVFPALRESTEEALRSTLAQAERWHGRGRIRYAVAPRFLLSCTDGLLKEAYAMTASFPGMLFHTHAAESRRELEAVRKRCGLDNIEFFEKLGILRANTCLAHCIWISDVEAGLLRERDARVLHCPTSNLKLGSGIAPIPDLLARGVSVSLGADGAACNNSLDMFGEMRHAALIQKPLHGPTAMNAATVFELATLGGAAALGLGRETGSLERGKKADIALLDLGRLWNPVDETAPYSAIVYSGSPENVRYVMIDGAWVYRDGAHTTLRPGVVASSAKKELGLLLGRVH
ncbi:MAG TPA: amidohydrolase family protein [Bacteroidota bacterium]|nr:amidohydrolase family protein [Bacteroidota bacterium]